MGFYFILCLFTAVFQPLSEVWAGTSRLACGDKDFREIMGPVRDQGNKGWCYAYTSADLLTFRFFDQKHRVSANHLALKSNLFTGRDFDSDGGSYADVTKTALSFGVCNSESGDYSSFEKLSRLKLAFKNNDQILVQNLIAELSQPRQIFYGVPSVLIQHLLNYPEKNFAAMVLLYICDQKLVDLENVPVVQKRTDQLNPSTQLPYIGSELLQVINEQLSRNNIVGISYNWEVLYRANPKTYARHASSIIGRRWKNNQCEYLIRNSWGTNCGTKEKPHYFSFEACEEGNIWMPEEMLLPELKGIAYLPDKNSP